MAFLQLALLLTSPFGQGLNFHIPVNSVYWCGFYRQISVIVKSGTNSFSFQGLTIKTSNWVPRFRN